MKVMWLIAAFVLDLAPLPPDAAGNPAGSTEAELIAIEHRWNDAFLRKDSAALSEVLADDFVIVYGNGERGDKRSELAGLASTEETIDSSTLADFDVRVYGQTAVVLYTLSAKGVRHGKPLDAEFRYMDVFVHRDGKWQCVASQNTRIGELQ